MVWRQVKTAGLRELVPGTWEVGSRGVVGLAIGKYQPKGSLKTLWPQSFVMSEPFRLGRLILFIFALLFGFVWLAYFISMPGLILPIFILDFASPK